VHEMMIYQFVTLNLKHTSFGTFVDSINQMHRLHHTRDTLSYYDCVSARKSPNLHFVDDRLYEVRNVNIYCFISGYTFISDHSYLHTQPFSSFHDSNEYCGIKLTRNLCNQLCLTILFLRRQLLCKSRTCQTQMKDFRGVLHFHFAQVKLRSAEDGLVCLIVKDM